MHASIRFKADLGLYFLENISLRNKTWILANGANPVRVGEGDIIEISGLQYMLTSQEEGNQLTFDGTENHHIKFIRESDGEYSLASEMDAPIYVAKSGLHRLLPGDVFRIGEVSLEVRRFNHGRASVQGIRPSMEDEDTCLDAMPHSVKSLSMFNIYDGHGGSECSAFLKRYFPLFFAENYSHEVPRALIGTFEESDEKFLEYVRRNGLSQNVGSVVCSVIIDSQTVYCANLGDSRAILGLSDCKSGISLSRDLKPSLQTETDRIKRCGGFVSNNRVNGRLGVSRAIGDFEFKVNGSGVGVESIVSCVPEIRSYPLFGANEPSFVVIACDGLFDVMTSIEVIEFVNRRIAASVARSEEPDPEQVCIDLITECVMKRGTTDNVSVIIVFLHRFVI
jgi:serine/threonine protein phosphatase PrpC